MKKIALSLALVCGLGAAKAQPACTTRTIRDMVNTMSGNGDASEHATVRDNSDNDAMPTPTEQESQPIRKEKNRGNMLFLTYGPIFTNSETRVYHTFVINTITQTIQIAYAEYLGAGRNKVINLGKKYNINPDIAEALEKKLREYGLMIGK